MSATAVALGSAPGEPRLARRLAVTLAVVIVVGFAIGLAVSLTIPAAAPSDDKSSPQGIGAGLPFLFIGAIAILLTVRRPRNPVGWLLGVLVVVSLLQSLGGNVTVHWLYAQDVSMFVVVPLGLEAAAANAAIGTLLVLLFLLFPDGRWVSPRWRFVGWAAVAVMVPEVVVALLDPAAINDGHRQVANPLAVAGIHSLQTWVNPASTAAGAVLVLLSITSLVVRYRRGDGEQRQQLKWFVAGVTLIAAGFILGRVANWPWPAVVLANIGVFALPASIAIAVLKYRLYDLDLIVNRALVYGALAAFITAVYVAIVVGVGTLIGSGGRPNLGLSILATGVVAVGFQPVRERLQRVANRLVYGRRATPYEVLSEFSERVAETYSGDDVLPRMATVLAEGTGAQAAAVWLRRGAMLHLAASAPATDGGATELAVIGQILPQFPNADRAVPVRHQGELLGALAITKRRGESLTPIEEKLLDDLAHQAGLVLKNVGLTADLQARLEDLRESRRRLVAAQDQERRRLERNLHDGAQQHLVALKVKLGLAEMLSAKDPERAKATIAELKGDADEALETLRDLARGIYPPLLADKGLTAALEAQARKATLPVTVQAEGIGRYPQEVEAAVYFCVLEALQNVQKYAGATHADVRLGEADGQLGFEVVDDGTGFDVASAKRGSGLTNMADRLDALGGALRVVSDGAHTTIGGRLPVPASQVSPA